MVKKGSGRRDPAKTKSATMYAPRDGQGRFKDMSEQGRSLKRDGRTKAKTKGRSGYGHRGDRAA